MAWEEVKIFREYLQIEMSHPEIDYGKLKKKIKKKINRYLFIQKLNLRTSC